MNLFSQQLKNYYHRDGNKIIFCNLMTLSELALAMWEKLGNQEIDGSVLSRVLHGKRLFSRKQLVIFCKILALSELDSQLLKQLLTQEILTRYDMGFSLIRTTECKTNGLIEQLPTNIYFTAAISRKAEFGKYYQQIIEALKSENHQVVHEHISNKNLSDIQKQSKQEKTGYYQKFLSMMDEADIVVAEVSFPATINIGYEISLALERNKPVIGLYRQGLEMYFLEGNTSDNFILEEYDDESLEIVIKNALRYAKILAFTSSALRRKLFESINENGEKK